MRVRGLKRLYNSHTISALVVAPHAGAWIETLIMMNTSHIWSVAPHAGAWIETLLFLRHP